MATDEAEAVRELAKLHGIELAHEDGFDRRVEPSLETLAAVIGAVEGEPLAVPEASERLASTRAERAQRLIEAVSVIWGRATPAIRRGAGLEPGTRVHVVLRSEDGKVVERSTRADQASIRLPLDETLPYGYYEVEVRVEGETARDRGVMIVAPEVAHGTLDERDWGVFLPLYALRSERSGPVADLSDLENLLRWTDDRGGAVVGTLPLMPTYMDTPFDPSPYAPVSRLFWNEIYLDPTRLPEWEAVRGARELRDSSAFAERMARARADALVDYREAAHLQRELLQPLADHWANEGGEDGVAFRAFLETSPDAPAYAAFRATVEKREETWERWPPAWRKEGIPRDAYDESARRRHLYAQFRFREQLATAVGEPRGDAAGLYLDLPLGPHPLGYDPWARPDLFATGAGMGAPPDAFHEEGQSWGLPPMRPRSAREDGHHHLRAILAELLPPSRWLRIDHVMGLHRVYWVPDGMSAADGAYVRGSAEEAYAILCLESRRHEVVVVGEDLGTVPDEVRTEMERRRVRRMYVLPFEVEPEDPEGFGPVPAGSLATLDTHDLPTFAAAWRDDDGTLRTSIRKAIHDSGGEAPGSDPPGAPLTALQGMLRWMGGSRAGMVLVNLEDLWLEEAPQNRPGTADPANWKRRARLSLEELAEHPEVLSCLEGLRSAREDRSRPRARSYPDGVHGKAATTRVRKGSEG